jgi:2-polyprenyl-6-methoxyphenol hydroxylase-like FAD-dependent oxidoreductase
LNEDYSSVVWSIKKNLAKQLLDLSDEELAAQVNHAFVIFYQLIFKKWFNN